MTTLSSHIDLRREIARLAAENEALTGALAGPHLLVAARSKSLEELLRSRDLCVLQMSIHNDLRARREQQQARERTLAVRLGSLIKTVRRWALR